MVQSILAAVRRPRGRAVAGPERCRALPGRSAGVDPLGVCGSDGPRAGAAFSQRNWTSAAVDGGRRRDRSPGAGTCRRDAADRSCASAPSPGATIGSKRAVRRAAAAALRCGSPSARCRRMAAHFARRTSARAFARLGVRRQAFGRAWPTTAADPATGERPRAPDRCPRARTGRAYGERPSGRGGGGERHAQRAPGRHPRRGASRQAGAGFAQHPH